MTVRKSREEGRPAAPGLGTKDTRTTLFAAMLVVGMGAAPVAFAADDAGASDERGASSAQPGAQTGSDGGMAAAGADSVLPEGLHKASDIIGRNVKDSQGDDVGEIKDLALDTTQGRVQYAVVSTGGILGVGGNLHAVPLNSLDSKARDDAIVLNMSSEELKNMQGFDDDNWPATASIPDGGGSAASEGDSVAGTPGAIVKASEYLNKDVVNLNDQDLGDIHDLAINLETGEIKYAVVERGGALGVGEKLIAVPTDALSPGRDDAQVVISATEDQLESVRGFSDDNWPEEAEFAGFESDRGDKSPSDDKYQRSQDPADSPAGQDPMQPQSNP